MGNMNDVIVLPQIHQRLDGPSLADGANFAHLGIAMVDLMMADTQQPSRRPIEARCQMPDAKVHPARKKRVRLLKMLAEMLLLCRVLTIDPDIGSVGKLLQLNQSLGSVQRQCLQRTNRQRRILLRIRSREWTKLQTRESVHLSQTPCRVEHPLCPPA